MNPLLVIHHQLVRIPRTDLVAGAIAELARQARSVLDVGTGDGLVAAAVANRLGASVEGVDIQPQAGSAVKVRSYDGSRLPFDDAAFDVVVLSDILHHAEDPLAVLSEALRVARRAAIVKDHFAFGAWSARWLLALDWVGNAKQRIPAPGNYLTPSSWLALVEDARGVVAKQIWPLDVHVSPLHLLTRSRLQFAARVEHAPGSR